MTLDTARNDLQDLQTILSKIGKVAGYVKVFNVEDNITSDIQNEFSNEVKSAKGIWVEFEILPTSSISVVNDVMCFINDNIDENCEVIFTTQTNENLPQNSVKCKILFTGLA
jgi:cell division GTPase FtsZ